MMSWIVILFCFVLGLACEAGVIDSWSHGQAFWQTLLLHLLAVSSWAVGLIFYSTMKSQQTRWKAVGLYCFFMATFFPILGAILSAFVFILGIILKPRRPKEETEEWESPAMAAGIFPAHRNVSEDLLVRHYLREVNVQPFSDIIHSREARLKTRVIEKLAGNISKDNINFLRMALRDCVAEVRLCAASVLLKIESKLGKKMQKAMGLAKTRGTVRSYTELADIYWLYATVGLVDGVLGQYYLHLAVQTYQKALRGEHDAPDLFLKYGRCLVELGRLDQARLLMELAKVRWPDCHEFHFLMNEIYFRLGNFQKIRENFKEFPIAGTLKGVEKDVWQFWQSDN